MYCNINILSQHYCLRHPNWAVYSTIHWGNMVAFCYMYREICGLLHQHRLSALKCNQLDMMVSQSFHCGCSFKDAYQDVN